MHSFGSSDQAKNVSNLFRAHEKYSSIENISYSFETCRQNYQFLKFTIVQSEGFMAHSKRLRLNYSSKSLIKLNYLAISVWVQFCLEYEVKMSFYLYKVTLAFVLTISGLLSAFAQHETFIFGGERATENQFPFLVSLRAKIDGEFMHVCGASVLADRFLVTAGHCNLLGSRLDEYQVAIGAHMKNDPADTYNLKKFVVHPNHVNHPISKMSNDVALLVLEKPITFNENITTIELNRDLIKENVDAVVAGWGTSEVSIQLHFLLK